MTRSGRTGWIAIPVLGALLLVFTFGLLGPFRGEAARKRGLELARQGRWTEARHQLDQALELDARDAEALRARSRVLARLRHREEALADLREARRIVPKDEGLRAAEIDLLVEAGRPKEALACAREARIDLPSSRPGLDLGLATVRATAAAGALHDAVAELDLILETHGRSHRAYHLKGQLCRELGEETRARAAFAEAVTLAPGIARYRRALSEEAPGVAR